MKESSDNPYPGCWADYVKQQMEALTDKDGIQRSISWLAAELAINDRTLRAKADGSLPPPDKNLIDQIASLLHFHGKSKTALLVEVETDITVAADFRQFPSHRRNRRIVIDTARRFAWDLYNQLEDERAILWLPFIMQELRPHQFRANKLVIRRAKATSITVPPQLSEPTLGRPQPVTNSVVCQQLLVREDWDHAFSNGTVTREELIATYRNAIGFQAPGQDVLMRLPTGQLTICIGQDAPTLFYEAPVSRPVYAVTDGVVHELQKYELLRERDSYDSDANPIVIPDQLSLCLDTLSGYHVRYENLSKISVSEHQKVKRGDILGLTGQLDERTAGVQVMVHLGTGYEPSSAGSYCFVDPSILMPIFPKTEVLISEPEKASSTRQLTGASEHNQTMPISLAEMLHAPRGVLDIPEWRRYLDQPFMIIPDGKFAGDATVAVVLLAGMALWLPRHIRRASHRP